MEDEHIYKRHNKTSLLYHLVFPLKYRKKCLDEKSGETLKEICIAISERYEIQFLEVGYESDHDHFLIQAIPKLSVSSLLNIGVKFSTKPVEFSFNHCQYSKSINFMKLN